jgi:hypothetical protein
MFAYPATVFFLCFQTQVLASMLDNIPQHLDAAIEKLLLNIHAVSSAVTQIENSTIPLVRSATTLLSIIIFGVLMCHFSIVNPVSHHFAFLHPMPLPRCSSLRLYNH